MLEIKCFMILFSRIFFRVILSLLKEKTPIILPGWSKSDEVVNETPISQLIEVGRSHLFPSNFLIYRVCRLSG